MRSFGSSIKGGLLGLIMLCVGLRVLAWVVRPALPVLVVLFVLVSLLLWAILPRRRL